MRITTRQPKTGWAPPDQSLAYEKGRMKATIVADTVTLITATWTPRFMKTEVEGLPMMHCAPLSSCFFPSECNLIPLMHVTNLTSSLSRSFVLSCPAPLSSYHFLQVFLALEPFESGFVVVGHFLPPCSCNRTSNNNCSRGCSFMVTSRNVGYIKNAIMRCEVSPETRHLSRTGSVLWPFLSDTEQPTFPMILWSSRLSASVIHVL